MTRSFSNARSLAARRVRPLDFTRTLLLSPLSIASFFRELAMESGLFGKMKFSDHDNDDGGKDASKVDDI